jgi:hypothetical protein
MNKKFVSNNKFKSKTNLSSMNVDSKKTDEIQPSVNN